MIYTLSCPHSDIVLGIFQLFWNTDFEIVLNTPEQFNTHFEIMFGTFEITELWIHSKIMFGMFEVTELFKMYTLKSCWAHFNYSYIHPEKWNYVGHIWSNWTIFIKIIMGTFFFTIQTHTLKSRWGHLNHSNITSETMLGTFELFKRTNIWKKNDSYHSKTRSKHIKG